jgi:O-acetyl-ADP-ribose deacetylase (regulator of RNase III)
MAARKKRSAKRGTKASKATGKTAAKKGTRKAAGRRAARTTAAKAKARKAKAATVRETRPRPPAGAHDRLRAKTADELPLETLVTAAPIELHEPDVEHALRTGDPRFRVHVERLFGETLAAELGELARQASRAPTRGGPHVWILPGIMGSTLGYERWPFDDVIWVDPIDIAAGYLLRLAPSLGGKRILPLGVLLSVYLKLKLKLRLRGIDAEFRPYDWRLDLRDVGAELARRIEKDVDERGVTLVAHSMGGLVARRALKVLEERGKGALVRRVVMLGTPNHGSYAPVTVLRKCHGLTRKLAALDLQNDLDELVRLVFGKLKGLAQLLPQPDRSGGLDLLDAQRWPGPWRPPQEVLHAARSLPSYLSTDSSRMVLIAGVDRPTLVGARVEGDAFTFRESRDGDGTVPLALAQLAGVTSYYSRAAHGSLPGDGKVIDAVTDLVKTGATDALPLDLPVFAPGERDVKEAALLKREVVFGGRRGTDVSPAEMRELLAGFVSPPEPRGAASPGTTASAAIDWSGLSEQTVEVGRKRQRSLDIRVVLGDIAQVDARAIVLGIYAGVEPSGAANALDEHLGGAIRDLVERGLLSGSVGQVFLLPAARRRLCAEHVVFVGLGEMDRFDDGVRRKVARNVAHMLASLKVDDFATVLLGSGSGDEPGAAMASMLAGFLETLRETDAGEHLHRVTICERERARFDAAVANLRLMLTSEVFDDVRATFSVDELPAPPALAVRGERGDRPDDPVYLMARQQPEPRRGRIVDVMHLSLLTADGNATVLVGDAELDARELDRKLKRLDGRPTSKTLDELGDWIGGELLPRDVRDGLAGSPERHLIVVHDEPSSRVPWEALRVGSWTPALRGGVSRKLAAADLPAAKWLLRRPVGERFRVLLVVNPTEDLPGAAEEGRAVQQALEAAGGIEVVRIEGPDATRARIQVELRSGGYDVLHYAGHAFYDVEQRERSGLLCHGEVVFSSGDMVGLEGLPALAVINACESARVRQRVPVQGLAARSSRRASRKVRSADTVERVRLKASLAEAFLRGGIRGYVGTYWPVGDAAAETFARTFYENLLVGETVSDALIAARRAVRQARSIDWADYIHYGTRTMRLREPGPREHAPEAGAGADAGGGSGAAG